MNTQLEHALTRLGTDQFMRIDNGQGRTVLVFRGRVWITQDHDPRDIVLRAGESFTLDRPAAAIVQALDDSSLLLLEPAPTPTPAPRRPVEPRCGPGGHGRAAIAA